MLDSIKSRLQKPVPQKPDGPPTMNEPQEIDEVAYQARLQFLENQALMLMNTVRGLKVQLMMATLAGELAPQLREHLYGELLQCAGIVEEKKG